MHAWPPSTSYKRQEDRCLNVIIKFRASLDYVKRLTPLIP